MRAFGVVLDLQHGDGQAAEPLRVMPHLRSVPVIVHLTLKE